VRTAIGVGALTFYVVLFIAGAQDIGAQKLGLPVPTVTWTLRVLVVALPPLMALLALKLCHDLARKEELEAEKEEIRHPEEDQPPEDRASRRQPPGPGGSLLGRAVGGVTLAVAKGASRLVDRIFSRKKVRR